MLFALWGVFITVGLGVHEINKKRADIKRKSNTKDGITYIDSLSKMRLLSNNHPCIVTYNHGDKEIIDCITLKVVWSAKADRINKEHNKWREDAIKKMKTTFRCDNHNDKMHFYEEDELIHGHIYEDFKTGRRYVIRESRNDRCYFYVDIETLEAIRYTDYTLQNIEKILSEKERLYEKYKESEPNKSKYFEKEKIYWLKIKNGEKLIEWNKQDNYSKQLNKKESKYGEKLEEDFIREVE